MKKGDMVRFELEGKTLYGTIISIVDDVCAVTSHSYSTGENIVVQRKINELVKIGSK